MKYSISIRKAKPGDSTSEKTLAYPTFQMTENLTLEAFAKHISTHGSIYTRDVIQGVLTKAVDCMREQLLQGNKIQLGELGSFVCGIRVKGAESAEECTAANIRGIVVNFTPGASLKSASLMEDAEWECVPSKKAQADAVAESRQQATHE